MAPLRAPDPRPPLRLLADPPFEEDRRLAKRVAAGDRQAAAQAYDLLAPRMDRAILRVFGRREQDHRDVLQSAFVELVRSLGSYRGDCSLACWAARIAAHVSFNVLRSRKRSRAVFFSPDSAGPEPAARWVDPSIGARVRSALAELPADKAEIVLLFDLLGHDIAEIAAMLELTEAAAQSRLVRARRSLRERLDAEEGAR